LGKSTEPVDSDGQGLAAGFVDDAIRLAISYRRRCAADVPLEEMTGEALVALTYAAARFDPARNVPLKNWAVLVIHDALAKVAQRWRRWRQAVPWPFADDGRPIEWVQTATDPSECLDVAVLLDRAREVLPAKLYRVLQWRFGDGLTLNEIGQRLGGVTHQRAARLVDSALVLTRRWVRGAGLSV
jgi:RNA polymerase sigma factor (sigma-70 family)